MGGRLVELSVIHLQILGNERLEQGSRTLRIRRLEQRDDAAARVGIDDSGVRDRIVEAAELQEDALHPSDVSEIGQHFTHHSNLVVLALPKLAPPKDQAVVRIAVEAVGDEMFGHERNCIAAVGRAVVGGSSGLLVGRITR